MPEIWLNYGIADVVLDIKAENLEQKIDSDGKVMENQEIVQKISSIDLTKPIELVVLQNSRSVQKVISSLFTICEQKSKPFPKIFADKQIMNMVKEKLPEGSSINEFNDAELSNSNLFFVGEVEFDGLFGYETISTRLLRKFGQDSMLSAYAKRKSNNPMPGQISASFEEAKRFSDGFEIHAIEIVANSNGIIDFMVGHPSQTASATKILESSSIIDVGQHKSVIISTGKNANNDTLGSSLSSLWNCASAIKHDGLAILVAECKNGIGSEAIHQFIENRLGFDQLKNPTKYVDGMEDLLFLSEIQKNFQIGLLSILPDFYLKKLNMISLSGIKQALDYILKTQGQKQKVAIVTDGARLLLR